MVTRQQSNNQLKENMKSNKSDYQAPQVELLATENESPFCTSALPTDPFIGVPIGNEL